MKVTHAAKIWVDYHRSHSKKNTLRSYESVIAPFCRDYGNLELEELTVDLVQTFLESITNGRKPQTRKIRFAHLTSFFNFARNNLNPDF